MGDAMVLAVGGQSSLKAGWDKFLAPILDHPAGRILTNLFAIAALCLAIVLIVAWICHAMGRAPSFTGKFCSLKSTLFCLVLIALLLLPAGLMGLFLGWTDLLITFLGSDFLPKLNS
ncbi:hypothetical protein GCM10007377_15590 [Galliscardovia ingluviei]|uniref:Uncharacterized protein n=1 Tax=Galliscardovia ingluviei TaxID=1769422 RepID=A0A8J3F0C8_9BIFI|nr:hypothetical protein [Galliscardovia ingluviei]GGI15376.1 hypothetical protein GCM10007377_15590 [Galliscardovia ingluviei]